MDQRLPPAFRDPAQIHDELIAVLRQHGSDSPEFRPGLLRILKDWGQNARETARLGLESDGDGRRCATLLSLFQDELIRLLYNFTTSHIYRAENPSTAESMAIIATGGYGRGLMAPGSDVDLLFLLPYKKTPWGETVAEFILYLLWDLGFKVGHATRSVPQTIRFAKTDIITRSALLDARFIVGEPTLWEDFESQFHRLIEPSNQRDFIAAKLAERDQRHARSGSSRYRVEPNIKDGKGGLRDLHTLHWIAKHINPAQPGDNFVDVGVYTEAEYSLYKRCEAFLWTVRCHLHFLTGKAEETLTFDVQQEMAKRLRYNSRGGMMAVERFMKHYFLVAKDVGDLTRILCSSLEVKQLKSVNPLNKLLQPRSWRSRVNISRLGDFKIENGRIVAKNANAFKLDPVNLIRIFAYAERNDAQFHPETLRLVRNSLKLIDDKLRNDPHANRLFLEILTSGDKPDRVLRRMNEAGVLGRFIPEFGKIISMMQFNMYHHYTVDEHLINSIGILWAIENGQLENELPLSTKIIQNIENRRALYVALFLHDIAKGRDEDHSIAGARIARELCPRLGLRPDETATVAWLVENHLVMSQFAQSRDLQDVKTIRDFSATVQRIELMNLLVILTAVDIRAVGPGVWTGWKGQLLRQLYYETEPFLTGGQTSTPRETRINEARDDFRKAIADQTDIDAEMFIKRQTPAYWLRTDLDHQLRHAKLIHRAEHDNLDLAFDLQTDSFTAITELTLWTRDTPGLVAIMAGACAAAKTSIVGANLTTTLDGMALNSLSLQRRLPNEAEEVELVERIVASIGLAIKGKRDLRKQVIQKLRRPARLEAFHVDPTVSINNSMSEELTVIEVSGRDRTGPLFDLARILASQKINIYSAQIATFGEKIVDVFYVTDQNRKKIMRESTQKKLREHLLEAFETGGDLIPENIQV